MSVPTTAHYARLPAHQRDEMRAYIERGVLPGDFIRMIVANDFVAAFQKADHVNRFALHDYAGFLAARQGAGIAVGVAAQADLGQGLGNDTQPDRAAGRQGARG